VQGLLPVQVLRKAARCARQPRLFYADTHHPYKTNGVRRNSKSKNGFPKDRRLRADGSIIRAGFANTCANVSTVSSLQNHF
jgi:hypothetical protein